MIRNTLSLLLRSLGLFERAGDALSAAAMLSVMLVVFVDVLMRYLFNAPFSWSYDLISLYLVTVIFYASLSATAAAGEHVSVDILFKRFPLRVKVALRLVGHLLALAVFVLITVRATDRCLAAFVGGDVLAGRIAWPTWVSPAIVASGSLLMSIHLALSSLALLLVAGGMRPSAEIAAVMPEEDSPAT